MPGAVGRAFEPPARSVAHAGTGAHAYSRLGALRESNPPTGLGAGAERPGIAVRPRAAVGQRVRGRGRRDRPHRASRSAAGFAAVTVRRPIRTPAGTITGPRPDVVALRSRRERSSVDAALTERPPLRPGRKGDPPRRPRRSGAGAVELHDRERGALRAGHRLEWLTTRPPCGRSRPWQPMTQGSPATRWAAERGGLDRAGVAPLPPHDARSDTGSIRTPAASAPRRSSRATSSPAHAVSDGRGRPGRSASQTLVSVATESVNRDSRRAGHWPSRTPTAG
jgi:hypothetical protein